MTTRLDGTRVAASSVKRIRRALNPVLEYAVHKQALPTNPLPKQKAAARTKPNTAIDKRCLISLEHTALLLDAIYHRPRGGPRLHAFFATLRYCGLRPEEAVALRVSDVTLPEEGWGELTVHRATPEVGRQWTDSGEIHDNRPLKGREAGDTRLVPVQPDLVKILRAHIVRERLKPGDILFKGNSAGCSQGSCSGGPGRGPASKSSPRSHTCSHPRWDAGSTTTGTPV
ncbi:tyrosine-type recombinase/integrase [Streptacidiphilus monticola]